MTIDFVAYILLKGKYYEKNTGMGFAHAYRSLVAGCFFFLSFVSGDSEEWRLLHATSGFALAGVLLFRLFWGFAGSRYARFKSFLFSPLQALQYLGSMLKGKPAHWVGHNPAGSYAIYVLMLLGFAVAGSGWAVYEDVGGEWLEEAHEVLANSMLGVVGLHVAGVVVGSLLHRENLVRSMINGYKQGRSEEGIASSKKYWVALLLLSLLSASLLAFAA
jgi:cytochrome b